MRITRLALAIILTFGSAAHAEETFVIEDRSALHAEIRDYLLDNPEILREAMAVLEAREAEARVEADSLNIAEHADVLFNDGYSYVGGNPDGALEIVEFIDYQCTYCKRAHPEIMAIVAANTEVRYTVKELPLLGPGSVAASRIATAVLDVDGPETYAALGDVLLRFGEQLTEPALLAMLEEVGASVDEVIARASSEEITTRLNETRALANAIELTGTPTFIIGDRMIRGFLPRESMEQIIDDVMAGL